MSVCMCVLRTFQRDNLICSGEKPGYVYECDDRNVEAVQEPDESAQLLSCIMCVCMYVLGMLGLAVIGERYLAALIDELMSRHPAR